jgi:hypothetical protein
MEKASESRSETAGATEREGLPVVALTKGVERIEVALACGPLAPFGYLVRAGVVDRTKRVAVDQFEGAGWSREG